MKNTKRELRKLKKRLKMHEKKVEDWFNKGYLRLEKVESTLNISPVDGEVKQASTKISDFKSELDHESIAKQFTELMYPNISTEYTHAFKSGIYFYLKHLSEKTDNKILHNE